jgi:hypothetical protein
MEKENNPGLSYVPTKLGINLPVLDITHPLFVSSIDREIMETEGEKLARRGKVLKKLPGLVKTFLGKRSIILGGFFLKGPGETCLNAMSTLMFKLGPGLIGGGGKRRLDRFISGSPNGMSVRMRLRDMAQCQANALVPLLKMFPRRGLRFINIAGGSACDSINALILVHQQNPPLLKNRKIQVDILDTDNSGPHYAQQCIEILKAPGHYFHGLDISTRFLQYDWNKPGMLRNFLPAADDWIMIGASEGGLFEYGSDEAMIRNLDALYDHSPGDMKFVGSVVHDENRINPSISIMAEVTGMPLRLLGVKGLEKILAKTRWTLENALDNNPNVSVFTLKK